MVISVHRSGKAYAVHSPIRIGRENISFACPFPWAVRAFNLPSTRSRSLMVSEILDKIGIRNKVYNNGIKIYGNPIIKTQKKIVIKKFLKDHRVFMTSIIAALSFGGSWTIFDKDSINTSFPSFLKIINYLQR